MSGFSDYAETIDSLYRLTRIPLCLTNKNSRVIYCSLEDEISTLPIEYLRKEVELLKKNWSAEALPLMRYTESEFFLGIFALDEDYAILVGPTPQAPLDPSGFFSKNQRYLRQDQILHMQRICEQSSLADPARFAEMLAVCVRLLKNRPCRAEDILKQSYTIALQPAQDRPEAKLNNPDVTTPEMVITFVGGICSAIRSGNRYNLDEIWENNVPWEMKTGAFHENEAELIFIPLLSSMNNTAVSCGADSAECFSLIDSYTRRLQSTVITADGFLLVKNASYDFCRLVRETRGAVKRSALSQEIEKYIVRHISEKITAEDLADAFSLSKRQIFRVFQNEFQMTMTEYVTREKLRRAAILLQTSKYSISQICDMYGFSSQSYFAKRFSEIYGFTPSEFREGSSIESNI